jgi:hypothetical protein
MGMGIIPLMAYHFAAFTIKDIPVKSLLGNMGDELKGSQLILRKEYKNCFISTLADFGVYDINDSAKIKNKKYCPENLMDNEFIYIRRIKKNIKPQEDELSRVETKEKIMEDPKKLKEWVSDLLRKKNA